MTPQQIDTMKLALGALEDSPMSHKNKDAIDALRETLAEHAMSEVQRLGQEIEPDDIASILACRDMLDAQPVPPRAEQEPVAWTLLLTGEHHGLVGKAGDKFVGHPEHYERVDVYTTPPQRKPLTNGEIYTAYITATNQTLRATDERLAFAFARAIEAAHGIKETK